METVTHDKILIAAFDNPAETVMVTSLFRPLRKLCPESQIGLWVNRSSADFFEDQSFIDSLHASDTFLTSSGENTREGWREFKETCDEIKKIKYDLVFVLNADWKKSLACFLTNIPQRIGFKKRGSRWGLTRAIHETSKFPHAIDAHRFLIESWKSCFLSDDLWFPRLDLSSHDLRWGREWMDRQGWKGKPIIVLNPFNEGDQKRWPLRNWFNLVRTLSKRDANLRFVVIGSQHEEYRLKDELSLISDNRCKALSVTGRNLKSLLSLSKVVVGGDSIPMQIGVAMGKPVVSLVERDGTVIREPRSKSGIRVLKYKTPSDLFINEVEESVLELLRN